MDPRTPGSAVPASVKWLNDELDGIPSLSDQYPEASLATEVDKVHQRTVDELRAIPGNSINHSVKLTAQDSEAKNARFLSTDRLREMANPGTLRGYWGDNLGSG